VGTSSHLAAGRFADVFVSEAPQIQTFATITEPRIAPGPRGFTRRHKLGKETENEYCDPGGHLAGGRHFARYAACAPPQPANPAAMIAA
jgi:hypothetical protein